MCPNEFQDKSIKIMREFGLYDWSFRYDRAVKRLGMCKYNSKILSFSLPYINLNTFEVMSKTLMHEIAHALVGANNNHNHIWRRKAIEIGATGLTCADTTNLIMPKPTYILNCYCNNKSGFYRKPKGEKYRCVKCKFVGPVVQRVFA